MYPEDRKYTRTHEWVKTEGNILTMGITAHAVEQLMGIEHVCVNEIVSGTAYKPGLELQPLNEEDLQDPEVKKNTRFLEGKTVTEVDTQKGFTCIYSPVQGKVIEMNDGVNEGDSEGILLIDRDPYGKGWMAKIEILDPDSLVPLMTAKEYQEYLLEEEESE